MGHLTLLSVIVRLNYNLMSQWFYLILYKSSSNDSLTKYFWQLSWLIVKKFQLGLYNFYWLLQVLITKKVFLLYPTDQCFFSGFIFHFQPNNLMKKDFCKCSKRCKAKYGYREVGLRCRSLFCPSNPTIYFNIWKNVN